MSAVVQRRFNGRCAIPLEIQLLVKLSAGAPRLSCTASRQSFKCPRTNGAQAPTDCPETPGRWRDDRLRAWAAMSSRVLCADGLDVCGCRALTLHARGRAIVSLESDWGRQRTLIGIG